MHIDNITDFKQNLIVDKEKKSKYGEIFTPFSQIKEMYNMIPDKYFTMKHLKWLDPGSGTGYFSIFLFWKLDSGLKMIIPNKEERKSHIIQNMLYMVELQKDNFDYLKSVFGEKANILYGDYREIDFGILNFDFVIGNPPYNFQGIKKVPTNNFKKKKEDGKTIWIDFIKKSISLLKHKGKLLIIVPSIWMKPDKAKTYEYLTSYKINKLRCLSNTETNKIFSGQAQTPTCYFLLTKQKGDNEIKLYDKCREKYIDYKFKPGSPLPVFGVEIINKLQYFTEKYGKLNIIKTNLPSKNSLISLTNDSVHKYSNIHTTILNNLDPELVIRYSNKPLIYNGKCKLVMAHKMYGFPYIDEEGKYGISNRDNYVVIDKSLLNLKRLRNFFSTKTALYLFETTRYRMKYLEKYVFQLIPDITQIPDFPEVITDESIAEYFNFDDIDRENIQKLHKKNYTFIY